MRDAAFPSFRPARRRTSAAVVLAALAGSILRPPAPLAAAQGNKVLAIPEDAFPTSIRYSGEAKAADGRPLEGHFTVDVRLLRQDRRSTQLWQERFAGVAVSGGRFAVDLGRRQAPSAAWPDRLGAARIFAVQLPARARPQLRRPPASGRASACCPPATRWRRRLVLDGLRQPNDGKRHWIWYDHR